MNLNGFVWKTNPKSLYTEFTLVVCSNLPCVGWLVAFSGELNIRISMGSNDEFRRERVRLSSSADTDTYLLGKVVK